MNERKLRGVWIISLIAYGALLIKLILLKDSWTAIFSYSLQQYLSDLLRINFHKANFTPFASLYYYLSGEEPFESGFQNIAGNIILFFPYGLLLALRLSKNQFKKAFSIMFLTSLVFEIIQLITTQGIFDIDDCLLNSFGGVLGFMACRLFFPSKAKTIQAESIAQPHT